MSKSMQELLAEVRQRKLAAANASDTVHVAANGATINVPAPAKPAPTPAKLSPKLPSKTGAIDALRAKMAASKVAAPTARPITHKEEVLEEYKELNKQAPATTGDAVGMSGEAITYNSNQQQFISLAASGNSGILLGAAGTGKTTATRGATQALLASGAIAPLVADGHKHLIDGTPGIVIVSYTRRAVNNIRKVQSEDLKSNCITVHKLLEYAPVYYEVNDPVTGIPRKTMAFEPMRNAENPLPSSIHTIIVEEASMLSLDYYQQLMSALSHPVQWLFIGDIQQLPPVFGPAILGFKMLSLQTVELTEVYRQALESPIIRLAHRILSGKPIPAAEYPDWHYEDQLKLTPLKKKLDADNAVRTYGAFFKQAIAKGLYNPAEDMILIPYNKACGTIELNNIIANYLARTRKAMTYEVMAGFEKHYLSVGDNVLYDREDAEVIDIKPAPAYTGARVQPPSRNLDYWGYNPKLAEENSLRSSSAQWNVGEDDVDAMLEAVASASEDRVTLASHIITLRLADTASEVTISKAAEVNGLLLAYALTVHKSQGSEWRKVFLCFHTSHATMLQRELLYTAVTRAKEELYVLCEPETFTKGITSQKIKGNTLAEKSEFFQGKVDQMTKTKMLLEASGKRKA